MKFLSIPLDPVMHTNIGLVWKKGRYVTSQMSEFIEFAKGYWN